MSAETGAATGGRLFGTDGVRGRAGDFLTAELALALGRAAVGVTTSQTPQVLIVRDTRESGQMLEAALAAGITWAGGDAVFGGVLPTPGAALLTRRLAGDAPPRAERAGRTRALRGAADDYLRELELRFNGLDLSGLKILLDCANGAAYRVGPEIFRRLGAKIDVVADDPDGRNINAGCGSTHVDGLAETVAGGSWDVAFALDGDADRVLAVDRNGTIVDGDEIIANAALHL